MVTYNTSANFAPSRFIVNPIAGRGSYTTIQAALDAAIAETGNQTIYIAPGTYTENIDYSAIVSNIDFIAVSSPGDNSLVVIDGSTTLLPATATLGWENIEFNSVTSAFSGVSTGTGTLTFTNCVFASTSYSIALASWEGAFVLEGCETVGADGVMNAGPLASVLILNSQLGNSAGTPVVFQGTTTCIGSELLAVNSLGELRAEGCIFGRLSIQAAGTSLLTNCSLISLTASDVFNMASAGDSTLANCVFRTSANPAISGAGAGILTLANPIFLDNSVIANTVTLSYNTTGEVAKSSEFVVDVAGGSPYKTIASALTAAAAKGGSQTVIVKDGTYTEDLTIPASISICSADSDSNISNTSGGVVIQGQITMTADGQSQLIGITLIDNGVAPTITVADAVNSPFLVLINSRLLPNTGVGASIGQNGTIGFLNCPLISANGVLLDLTSNGTVTARRTAFSQTAGASLISHNSSGTLSFSYCTASAIADTIDFQGVGGITSIYNSLSGDVLFNFTSSVSVTSASDIFQAGTALSAGVGTVVLSGCTALGTVNTFDAATVITSRVALPGSVRHVLGSISIFEEGSNGSSGVVTLTAGSATVSTNKALTTSRILLTRQSAGASTTVGVPSVGTIVNGVSFVIDSLTSAAVADANDISVVYWQIIQSV